MAVFYTNRCRTPHSIYELYRNSSLEQTIEDLKNQLDEVKSQFSTMQTLIGQILNNMANKPNSTSPKKLLLSLTPEEIFTINDSSSENVTISINRVLHARLKDYISEKYNVRDNASKILETAIIELLYSRHAAGNSKKD